MVKVSVIIPVYKVEKYIEKCAESLFGQTLQEMEFIFVDDATPDDSISILKDVLKKYPNREKQTKILHHEKNSGLTTTRNTGLAEASGEFIVHCDSDDWISLDMYETMYNKAVEDKADIVYCNINMVYPNETSEYVAAEYSEDKIQFLKNYIASEWTCLVNMLVCSRIYKTYSLKSPENISYCEDFWLSVRLFFFANKISKVDKPFYQYNRLNEGSIVHNLNKKAQEDEIYSVQSTINFFDKVGVVSSIERELSWRLLKSKQELVLDLREFNRFLNIYPQSHKYIFSNPYCNFKIKCMMWSLSHHLQLFNFLIVKLRTVLGR